MFLLSTQVRNQLSHWYWYGRNNTCLLFLDNLWCSVLNLHKSILLTIRNEGKVEGSSIWISWGISPRLRNLDAEIRIFSVLVKARKLLEYSNQQVKNNFNSVCTGWAKNCYLLVARRMRVEMAVNECTALRRDCGVAWGWDCVRDITFAP